MPQLPLEVLDRSEHDFWKFPCACHALGRLLYISELAADGFDSFHSPCHSVLSIGSKPTPHTRVSYGAAQVQEGASEALSTPPGTARHRSRRPSLNFSSLLGKPTLRKQPWNTGVWTEPAGDPLWCFLQLGFRGPIRLKVHFAQLKNLFLVYQLPGFVAQRRFRAPAAHISFRSWHEGDVKKRLLLSPGLERL